ncbi:MAG: hypothetical protein JNM20_09855 [Rhizobiales bacterium]|nr:hypothetical protein [Hyphomicrobiales bacterium]
MPICEADPWRLQYFENVPCPDNVQIPTEDADAWAWNPKHRWIYDKLRIAASQGLDCGPHGVPPHRYPVFSKPVFNLKGMGVGSRTIADAAELDEHYAPGHFWMELLRGEHVSTDCAVATGKMEWSRHTTGTPSGEGMFSAWAVHSEKRPELEDYLREWISRHLAGYTGMVNFETIGGRIIEGHLRFADQWPDLYGDGWVNALVRLYAEREWHFEDRDRRTGYSMPLFGRHGQAFKHPRPEVLARLRAMPGVSSVQITFHEDKRPEQHAMPPGGFRLGIVNAYDLESGRAARRELAEAWPSEAILNSDW